MREKEVLYDIKYINSTVFDRDSMVYKKYV